MKTKISFAGVAVVLMMAAAAAVFFSGTFKRCTSDQGLTDAAGISIQKAVTDTARHVLALQTTKAAVDTAITGKMAQRAALAPTRARARAFLGSQAGLVEDSDSFNENLAVLDESQALADSTIDLLTESRDTGDVIIGSQAGLIQDLAPDDSAAHVAISTQGAHLTMAYVAIGVLIVVVVIIVL